MAGESVSYLRVSLLNGCNFRCFYCYPRKELPPKPVTVAPLENLKKSIAVLHSLGIRKVRFTGGEPTLYRKLPQLVRFTKELDRSIHVAMTTNGFLMANLAPELADAGLDSVNISLDTLSPSKFPMITRINALERVLDGVHAAVRYIPEVKLNCVVMRGVNDHKIAELVSFADRLRVTVRFIEYMPNRHADTQKQHYISTMEMMSRLPFPLKPLPWSFGASARYYTAKELGIKIGFISPVSRPFCGGCRRIRLASDGTVRSCLFTTGGVNLFSLLDRGRDAAAEAVFRLMLAKQRRRRTGSVRVGKHLPSFVYIGG
jgi:cyclic pyranopterin phosphate synthase